MTSKQHKRDGKRGGKAVPFLLDPSRVPTLLWLPNLIGYVRAAALLFAFLQPDPASPAAVRALFLSLALDYFDGPAARALNMCSQFGDILDHVTDHLTMAWLVWISSSHPVNVWINLICNLPIPLAYMAITGHYYKHAAGGNWVTRAVEAGNYWNLPSLLWCGNCIIVPLIKLSYHAQHGIDAKASTEFLDFVDALGLVVNVAYTAAVLAPLLVRKTPATGRKG